MTQRLAIVTALFLVGLLAAGQAGARPDTLSVFFRFNESAIGGEASFRVDSAVYANRLRPGNALRIIGYADAVGTDSSNLRLSHERALAVRDYLVQSGFSTKDIRLIVARGESQAKAPPREGGNLADRRVDIVSEAQRPKADLVVRRVDRQGAALDAPIASVQMPDLASVRPGSTLLLSNIYFYPGRHVVRKESDTALQALLLALKAHPKIKIRIEGHVCCVSPYSRDAMDDDTHVEELSLNRAAAIRAYLVAHGIDERRLSIAGFGHRHPLVSPETTEDDANRNRRVEIRVLE